ncbi:MAG: rnd [Acidimicrobiales bacterium]|nr:rnd [Acidimicrobiales bacterium]
MNIRWIDTDLAFSEVIDQLVGADLFGIDTEFHRERTYYPQLALVQIVWGNEIVLVDPLAVDMKLFSRALDSPATVVMHAASQDLEVLDLVCGSLPTRLFDTQIAAGFTGHSLPSLVSLVEREFGVRIAKGDRLTDWLRRPLSAEQRAYAASDVAHLLPLYERLTEQLGARGRLDWALAECELARQRGRVVRDPEEAWLRIKEARSLRGTTAGIAKEVAAWRERRAAQLDQPVRFVLSDLALVGVAQRAPTSLDDLRRVRGLDDRNLRGRVGDELLAAVAAGTRLSPERPRHEATAEVDRALRPAVTLVSAWVSQLARDIEMDTSLLATRSDIEALLASTDGARLKVGWRASLVGEPIRSLVAGDAALAFDGNGGLLLERRSREPLL